MVGIEASMTASAFQKSIEKVEREVRRLTQQEREAINDPDTMQRITDFVRVENIARQSEEILEILAKRE
jgi:hypothetical protein